MLASIDRKKSHSSSSNSDKHKSHKSDKKHHKGKSSKKYDECTSMMNPEIVDLLGKHLKVDKQDSDATKDAKTNALRVLADEI